jgi:hypothetical protein
MKHHLKRFTAPTLVIAALILPIAITGAQHNGLHQRGSARQGQATGATQSITEKKGSTEQTQTTAQETRGRRGRMGATSTASSKAVTVVRRVNQATAPDSIISHIRSAPTASSRVTIQGKTVKPKPGNSMWLLSNQGYLVIGIDKPGLTPHAVEGDFGRNPDGSWYFRGCLCADRLGQGDNCTINSASNQTCNHEQDCCGWVEITLAP